jgi:hypothetical protein
MMHPFVRACVAASACGVAFALSVQVATVARADGPLGDLSGLDQLQGVTIERIDALPTAAPETAPPASAIEQPAPAAAPPSIAAQPAAESSIDTPPAAAAAPTEARADTHGIVVRLPAAGARSAARNDHSGAMMLAIAGGALIAAGVIAPQRRC